MQEVCSSLSWPRDLHFQGYKERRVVKYVYRRPRCERCDYLQNLISYLPILVELNIAKIFSFVSGMVCF